MKEKISLSQELIELKKTYEEAKNTLILVIIF